ncbi:NADH dehydrogenase [ubiquinone] 1 alpha subcomplex assembly factor 7 [Limimonas halophila]|uniref:NADH dehydrogenase [ubiquinone] 1 alpha subcomplex assembly factor 7 n=1 Tax=Limimonas halophila TaxID=1082479 RepID=A0A1G7LEK0_9PROT|nr:SAM-dependent methyltransferase [Limimonas halophila]SDF47796.1 NADH dehydrogenase [ubiquinone] 1 alpha subcomplex assembly factor 7 [Limimonas halophila]
MTALEDRIKRRIAVEGPISLGAYMAEVLAAPGAGYYAGEHDPLGAAGDFTTAPEISQMFGELLGLWCADTWQRLLGSPSPVHLVELGPGRGTLMADALRAARMMPGFREALDVHLVEISPALRAKQEETLRDAGVAVHWHRETATIPDGPLLVLANEFFDALPVRQMERTADGWCERLVAVDPERDALALARGAPTRKAAHYVPEELRDAPEGTVVEVSPAMLAQTQELAERIAQVGGAGLIVDFGPDSVMSGATLQAVRRHRPAEILEAPGETDLTAHVPFPLLARAAREAGAAAHGPVQQGTFLRALGIEARAQTLTANAAPQQARAIASALHRLTAPEEMGELFKALAITPRGAGTPAGFPETAEA